MNRSKLTLGALYAGGLVPILVLWWLCSFHQWIYTVGGWRIAGGYARVSVFSDKILVLIMDGHASYGHDPFKLLMENPGYFFPMPAVSSGDIHLPVWMIFMGFVLAAWFGIWVSRLRR